MVVYVVGRKTPGFDRKSMGSGTSGSDSLRSCFSLVFHGYCLVRTWNLSFERNMQKLWTSGCGMASEQNTLQVNPTTDEDRGTIASIQDDECLVEVFETGFWLKKGFVQTGIDGDNPYTAKLPFQWENWIGILHHVFFFLNWKQY